ncbi:MAG: carboxypeptidase regulatory-like domain-containing protein [Candidatus Cloacimonetes bacterium]|nr:carboxypeptidase regulatory-like domain-containing protein [Candidatus Cloacimonadota bacterium]
MKKILIFVIVFMIFNFVNLIAIHSEKTIFDLANRKEIVVTEEVSSEIINEQIKTTNSGLRTGLIWEASAEWAICKSVGISDETYHPFIGWHTNDEAWSYFGETNNIPLWEYDIYGAEYLPHDIISDGTYMVGGNGDTIYGFSASSGIPDWTYSIDNPNDDIFQIVISNDGSTIYFVSGDDYDYSFITSVDLTTSIENWSYSLPSGGYSANLVLSGNNEKILITQYYDAIIYSDSGELIFQTSIAGGSQCTPAISDDGNIFAFGSLSGYGSVYEYNVIMQTYNLKWQHQFVGGSYDWVYAIAISGDGSTVAFGSKKSNNGELAVFNIESSEPLWIYQSVNDLISDIDLSVDGSVIAASSYGPEDDSDNDFWFFNINSNEPVFSFNCQGSPYDIDLSNDGTRCIVGGKAVHSGTMGHGGNVYYFDNTILYGAIVGVVTNAETGNPLENALITVGTYTATSNSYGEYFIEQIEMGDYTLTCELTGYELYSEDITVDDVETINIALIPISDSEDILISNNKISLSNYPNPFNPSTTISFETTNLHEDTRIEIFNLKGQLIRKLEIVNVKLGINSVIWNGTDNNGKEVPSGIYLYKLKSGRFISTKKMILMK